MKKIHLTDGQPTVIRNIEESQEVINLTNNIVSICKKSGLSYVEINKALYLTDKELYIETINRRHSQHD